MKNAFLLGILLLTVSCGSEKKHAVVGGQEEAYSENSGDKYDLPEIGFHREVTLNHRFESVYEDMTIKPYSKKAVPGIKPFVLYLNDSAAFKMDFYPNQDILKVSYVNYGTAIGVIKPNDVTLALVNDPRFKTVKSFVDEFTYGMSGSQYPEQDILGKVFIVDSEAAILPYVSKMKIAFWVQCDEVCDSEHFKFNYKVLDYKLVVRRE